MDSQTIENFVIRLGRNDFRKVVSLLLRSVFGLNAINVDGTNDGGVDWRVFKDTGGSTSVAYQDTTQKEQTEAKAIEDAKKAVNKTGATKYFFGSVKITQGMDFAILGCWLCQY
jgi:O-acetyl-ADP-ribose deacetylase (regulator of RNase III)